MSGRPGRRKRKAKKPLMGSHQRCWIWGRNVVLETLAAGKWSPYELHLAETLSSERIEEARRPAQRLGTAVVVEPSERLTQLCRSAEHQGYIAKMPPYPYDDLETVLQKRPAVPLYVILDGLQDPYNMGAIVRSAEGLGVDAVFLGERDQVGVTSLVARTSAGAVNHVPIARTPDVAALTRLLQSTDFRIVGADEKARRTALECDFRRPTALIIGSEATGIRKELLKLCHERVRIPQFGRVGSLNAAVSAGILLYEARRQRGGDVG